MFTRSGVLLAVRVFADYDSGGLEYAHVPVRSL